ncbi:MAG: hypothetical protein ACQES9_10185, partial [Myxococcota bacterium]
VDSTFLAAVAYDVLGERALAVTATSPFYSAHEQREAKELAERIITPSITACPPTANLLASKTLILNSKDRESMIVASSQLTAPVKLLQTIHANNKVTITGDN